MGWDKLLFTFQSPGISPIMWGQAGGNNPVLSKPNITESLIGVGIQMLKPGDGKGGGGVGYIND